MMSETKNTNEKINKNIETLKNSRKDATGCWGDNRGRQPVLRPQQSRRNHCLPKKVGGRTGQELGEGSGGNRRLIFP